jgi:flavin reductase (DIM6/NTAB) family NADH-FMN oxidoreductase RutF
VTRATLLPAVTHDTALREVTLGHPRAQAEVGGDTAARAWARPVALVSARSGEALHVITATAVVLASMDPPILTVAVAVTSRLRAIAKAAQGFAVALLGPDAGHLAERFATAGRPADDRQLTGLTWDNAPTTGAPIVVEGTTAWFDCVLRGATAIPGTKHQILLAGEVVASARARTTSARGALLRTDGAYHPFLPAPGQAPPHAAASTAHAERR